MTGELTVLRPLNRSIADDELRQAMTYEASTAAAAHPTNRRDLLDRPYIRQYFEDWGREHDSGFAIECEGKPLGAAWFRLTDRFWRQDLMVMDVPEISIGLVETARGQGLGGVLLRALKQEARQREIPRLCLHVLQANEVARRLYDNHDFTVVCRTETPSPDMNGLIMTSRL